MQFFANRIPKEEQLALVARYQAGDRAAGEVLYQQYEGLLRKTAGQMANGMDREDAFQDLCVTFFEVLRRFDPSKGTSLPGTLRRYLNWRRHNLYRSWKARTQTECAAMEEYLEPRGGEINPKSSETVLRKLVAAVSLSPTQRRVLVLLYKGKTDQEIRQALSLSASSLSNMRRHIREKCSRNESLMEILAEWREIPEGYVDRSLYAFTPSWGVEKAAVLNAHWDTPAEKNKKFWHDDEKQEIHVI